MLRIEKIFKETEINDEISAYTQLIPDGDNLKATMLIMYPDVSERKIMLNRLNGIENNIYLQIDDIDKIFAVSDEDLERTKDGKTSAVHFLRFQLDKSIVEKFKSSNNILLGVEHENYTYNMKINNEVKNALVSDFE